MSFKKENFITVRDLLVCLKDKLKDKIQIVAGKKKLLRKIKKIEINRPGVSLSGYFKNFAFDRVQLFGIGEHNYLQDIDQVLCRKILNEFFSYKLPCCVYANNNMPSKLFIKLCDENNIPCIMIDLSTNETENVVRQVLEEYLLPQQTFPGVMVEVFGIGILILGKSSIGKSECALELITKGHRLIADDIVNVKKIARGILSASGNDLIKYHMEIRGIGIIDVQSLFGVGAVREKKKIDIVVILEEWEKDKVYERLGLTERNYAILDEELPLLIIPVKPGRNIPVIIETAAKNMRLAKMGIKSSELLNERIIQKMKLNP